MKTVTIQTRSCGGVEVIHVQNPYVVAVPGEKVKFVNTTSHEAVLTFKDVDSLEATPFSNCDATVTLGPAGPGNHEECAADNFVGQNGFFYKVSLTASGLDDLDPVIIVNGTPQDLPREGYGPEVLLVAAGLALAAGLFVGMMLARRRR